MAALLILVELAVVTAIAIFFSTFTSPVLAAAFTVGLVITGPVQRRPEELRAGRRERAGRLGRPRPLLRAARTWRRSTSRASSCTGSRSRPSYVALTAGYGVLYIAALLTMAALFFSRRDFK